MIFSVIVPFLNEEKYIESCIRSLIAQNFSKEQYELIFIDNGSQDRSVSIASGYPEVKLLFEKRKNVYAARNKGLSIARGQIIAFTDADCIADKNWIANIYRSFQDEKVEIMLGRRDFPKSDLALIFLAHYENEKVVFITNQNNPAYLFGFTNNMAIRRSVFEKIGTFKLLEVNGDIEIIQRYVQKEKNRVIFNHKAYIVHQEIGNKSIWFSKMYSYGFHNSFLQNSSEFKNLGFIQNLKILKQVLSKRRYSLLETGMGLFNLGVAFLAYRLGEVKAHI